MSNGDTYQVAGQITAVNSSGSSTDSFFEDPNTALNDGLAGIVGGNGIAVTAGDVLVNETVKTSPGEVDILGGRLLMFNNDDFIDGATKVVTAGGTLDFGAGGSHTVAVPVYFGANGAIETRGTDTIINNLAPVVGTSGAMPSLTIGTDDSGGGSITIANSVNLTNSTGGIELMGVQADNRGFTTVNFSGGFSGTGNLTSTSFFAEDYASQDKGLIFVTGANTYQGDTTVSSGILDLQGDNTAVTSAVAERRTTTSPPAIRPTSTAVATPALFTRPVSCRSDTAVHSPRMRTWWWAVSAALPTSSSATRAARRT